MAVFLLAIVGTGVLMVIWKRRGGSGPDSSAVGENGAGVAVGGDDALRDRIRRETEY